MTFSLQQRVARVGAAARRLRWVYGLARFGAAVLAIVVGLGLIDYLLRLHAPVARWLLSAVGVVLTIIAFLKLAWPAIRLRQSAVSTARRIELRFPDLGERLSSAIAFSAEAVTNPVAGSSALRQAVIAEAEAVSSEFDFQDALDIRGPSRALCFAAACVAVAGAFAAINPPAAGLAIARLTQPWRELAWPRRHELAFVGPPERLATGDDLEMTLIDRRGSLPDDLQFMMRLESPTGWRTEIRPLKPVGERAVFRLENVTHSFEYRACGGGDNTMPWTELSVVEPPKIAELQVTIQPPAYTALPRHSAGQVVKALVGSELRIRGKVDQPIRSAAIRSAALELPLPAVQLQADSRQFVVPAADSSWLVERSGAFWLELTDEHGLTFGRDVRIDLQVISDNPPSIAWETPADHSLVTRGALVRVKGTIKDDLAVRRVALCYTLPGKSDEEQVVEIRLSPDLPPSSTAAEPTAFVRNTAQELDFGWDLSRLAGLAAGDVLSVRILAEDYKPQETATSWRRLTIITDEEFQNRIADRQGAILSQLADALRLSRQCGQQLQSVELRLEPSAPLLAADRHLLQSVQLNQSHVERLVGAAPEGTEGQIVALLEELAANRVDMQASQRLKELLLQIHALNGGPISALHQELTDTIKSAGESNDAATDEMRQRLRQVAAQQHEVIHLLEKMVGGLTQWDNLGRVARELREIRDEQDQLLGQTDELRLKTVSASQEASAADHATARQLSERELELARRLDKAQARIEEMLTRMKAGDRTAAAALREAMARARRLAIGQQMRQAASHLTHLQFAKAGETEQRASDALEQLVETLSPHRGDARLNRIGEVLASLVDRQRNLLTETTRLDRERGKRDHLDADQQVALIKLTSAQQLVVTETDQLRQHVLAASAFGFALEQAAADMQRSSGMLRRGQTAAATQTVQRAALTRLEQIQVALLPDEGEGPREPPADNQDLTRQGELTPSRAASTAELKLLKLLQEALYSQTAELEAKRAKSGTLTVAQQQELDALAIQQQRLADILLGLIQQPGGGAK